jgi:hypothetical protein
MEHMALLTLPGTGGLTMAGMEITLLSVPDCPHVGLTRRRLEEAVRRSGVMARISEEVVASDADAARRTFVGSPTVLADAISSPTRPGRRVSHAGSIRAMAGRRGHRRSRR